MPKFTILFLLGLMTTAWAQQNLPPDPKVIQGAISALQQQRNSALDTLAGTQAQLSAVQEELAKVRAELAEEKKKGDSSAPGASGPKDH
jgi:septal ring factor EnvC (AmiA/AmiB activator)